MDMRVKKTLKNLLDSFEELLQIHRYEDITVSMLCDKAMLRRTTFYKHFDDKDSFFKFYMSQKRTELEEICGANTKELDFNAYRVYMLDTLMAFLTDNEALVNNIIKSSQSSTLLDSLAEFMSKDGVKMLQKQTARTKEMSACDCKYLAAAMSGSTIQTIKLWWANGHKSKERKNAVQANFALFPFDS